MSGETLDLPLLELLAAIRPIARHHGYAIAVHGSLSRDIDLVAVPWTDDAVPAEELVEVVRKAVGGFICIAEGHSNAGQDGYFIHPHDHSPEDRPHGRRTWVIQLVGRGTYLDLSVMPRGFPAASDQTEGG